ncbi:hypothetical protein T439DRAFT_342562 [Meredithblackwellia eburnea MCA 4105]
MLKAEEIQQHNKADDLWMVINGKAYDLTEFAPNHPGGFKILLKYAGKDATEEYEPIHPPGLIEETLTKDKHLGKVDMSTFKSPDDPLAGPDVTGSKGEIVPTLAGCLNLDDIEKAAEVLLKPKAWAYYASAADDERTKNWNHEAFNAVRLRPRVLRNVTPADLSTTMLGHKSSLPIFIAPAAMGRLAHPEGENLLAKVAGDFNFPYIVSANASIAFDEVAKKSVAGQTLFYQLYVNKDRKKTEEQLKKVVNAGYKGICVTVDAPIAGKRERDERSKMDAESAADPSMRDSTAAPAASLAASMFSYVDPALAWDDLAWIKKVTGLPLMVKGIQTAEDAALCAAYGVEAVYLSNHGGRQLEGAPSALETLLEIRKYEPQVLKQCEVYVDGGIRRGTDVLKALALGAKAVGVGRPFMYSLIFGEEGVKTVASILQSEIAGSLRLLGATSLSELTPAMVNTRPLEVMIYDGIYTSPSKKSKHKL